MKTREQYLDSGICPTCHKSPIVIGRKRCKTCLQRSSDWANKTRKKHVSLSLCPICGKNQPLNNYSMCQQCLDKLNQRNLKRIRQHINDHICYLCGNPADDGYSTCTICRTRGNNFNATRYHKRKDNNLCTSCNKPLVENRLSSTMCDDCFAKYLPRRLSSHSKTRYSGNLERVILRDKGCVICGIPYGGRPLRVVCHHIDSNVENNSLDNLTLLCKNCHSVATFFQTCESKQSMIDFLKEHYI